MGNMTNATGTAALSGPSQPRGRGNRRRVGLVLLAVFAVIAVLLTGGAFAWAKQFDDRALPGTTLLGQDVSGKTPEEISALVTEKAESVTVTVDAGEASHEASLADLGVSVDAAATAQKAVERDDSFGAVIASTWSGEHPVTPVVTVDEAAVTAYANGLVPEDQTVPTDAEVVFDEDESAWTVVPGTNGQGVDPTAFVETVTQQAATLTSFSVEQEIEEIAPAITTEEAEEVVGTISSALEQEMTITGADGETYEVPAERRSDWLSVAPDEAGQALTLSVDEEAVREWVTERAADESTEVKNGIEQIDAEGNVVKVVAEKQDGIEVTNIDAVVEGLVSSLSGVTPFESAFETATVAAEVEQVKAPEDEEDDAAGGDSDAPAATPEGEKWIDVDLSAKTVTAYVGDTPVWGPRSMVDGKEGNETVTGSYEIYLRYDQQDMTNASRYPEGHPKYYYTEDVPWVQYFHRGYGFHGAPWRSSFGYSGSHGCINMPVSEAKWLYDWASIGTRVEVHY